jgi:hypothetical protein
MGEKLPGQTENERKVALTILKLGGAAVTASSLSYAAAWAGRRLKFEHTAQRFTDDLMYLESEAVEHHHAVIRRVAAASLIRPEGLTRPQIKSLAVGNKYGTLVSEALHHLCKRAILEHAAEGEVDQFRPTQDFMKTLLEGAVETPKLLAAAREIYGGFSYDRLYESIHDSEVLDLRPLSDQDAS